MMLKIDNVHKYFGGIKALNGCSLGIEEGKITALIGPNGSGKSTLFNVISRLLKEDKGKINFKGTKVSSIKDYQLARQGISRTFQQVRLFHNLTIKQHIEIALSSDDEKMLASMFRKKKETGKQVEEILNTVGIDKALTTYATDLSYGQRKLLDLAIAIAKPHSLLMLDEPVAGINPKLRKDIKKILRNLQKNGETILLIEHDMNFVMDLADYIFVLDQGKVIAQGKQIIM